MILLDWWVFVAANAIQASAALTSNNAAISHDTLFNGQQSPIQYTRCWDNGVIALTDGRLAFRVRPGAATPIGLSVILPDPAAAALLPGSLPTPC